MLEVAIVLSVSAIPEGLPIAITVILALGMRRILQKNGLVKKLISIETLGSTSIICTDKTGTLTEGNMKVVKTEFIDKQKALLGLALTNNQKSNVEMAVGLAKWLDLEPEMIEYVAGSEEKAEAITRLLS
jgi:Ca2+-transporting ATPase